MRFPSSFASWSVFVAPVVLVIAASMGGACSSEAETLFTGATGPTGQGGAGGGTGGFGGAGGVATSSASTSASSGTTTSSSSTGSMMASSSSSSSGQSSSSSSGAGGGTLCAHDLCSVGDPLMTGCDLCVDQVCNQDQGCCDNFWGGNCIALADQLCNKGCCGNGECNGETCDSCQQDCGACFCGDGACNGGETCSTCGEDCGPCPTCPHSVCNTGPALSTQVCRDACVDQVCAQDPNCCTSGNGSAWTPACANLADMLCGGDPCITKVCMTNPSCCTQTWTQACVDAAKMACATSCACAHDVCAGGDKLDPGCDPCVASVCKSDPYCCNSGWDGICTGEAELICGINCP